MNAQPTQMTDCGGSEEIIVTVCDRAHEELEPLDSWLHWSIPDPVAADTDESFDRVVHELCDRIQRFVDTTIVMQ